ncbi:MAG: hypothetical protein ABFR36_09210 [Acidobacteriota bacterium]
MIILMLPYGFTRSQDQQYPGQDNFEDHPAGEIINGEEEGSVGDDFQSLEPDIFLRNLYQKHLKPLSNSDKIKWSFRMSDTDIFL